MPERDDQGRFMNDGGRRGGYSAPSRDDDRDYRSTSRMPERDDQGRFMNDGGRDR